MIKPEQVPNDVVEAARAAWLRSDVNAKEDWRASIAAALNAWPGMKIEHLSTWVMEGADLPYVEESPALILPLPQENPDAEA